MSIYKKFLTFPFLVFAIFFPFSLEAKSTTVNNADDLCYEKPTSSGLFCINMGICSGGLGCTNSYTLKNMSKSKLTKVRAIYDETGLGGTFGKSCGVTPVGSCTSKSNIDLGPFGFFGKTSYFTLADMPSQDNTQAIWAKNFISGSCFNGDSLYATYTKNGNKHRGKISPCSNQSYGSRDFELRHQENLFGDVKVLGNTVLCALNANGQCQETPKGKSNDALDLQKAPVSYSTLKMPDKSKVVYARLYWQGRRGTYSKWSSHTKTLASTIRLKKGNGTFQTFHADILDTQRLYAAALYSASAVVTDYIKNNGNGKYYIDTKSFYTHTGSTWYDDPSHRDGLGAYGAWVLVVVYQDPNETKARNVSIFDGYKTVHDGNSVNIAVSGFLTPKAHKVDSQLYAFAAEGDKYIYGDDFLMAGRLHNTQLKSIAPNSDDAFDSRIDILNTPRKPSLSNNNGIDIQEYNVGTTSGALGIITNNEIGAKFQFRTDRDAYFPSLLVFSTEIYLPKMCYDYSVRQDNQYLQLNRSAYPEGRIDGPISSSNLDVTVYLRNMEADIPAEGIAIKSDVNNSLFDFVGDISTSNTNGTTLIDRGTPNKAATLCSYDPNGDNSVSNKGCTNGHDIRKGNGTLRANEYVYTKYTLQPKGINGITDINESLGLSVRYYITINHNKSVYPDYILGSKNVPLCPPSNWYQAQNGIFNVVRRGQTPPVKSNLLTQVSRRPFDVSLIFDSTPETADYTAPEATVDTTVLVEMIDLDSFGDANASCANPDSKISDSIFVPVHFTDSDYQTDIPTQANNYYNVAVKNAAFRIWYFDDGNNTLVEHWNAITSNNNKNLQAISGLYTESLFPLCKASCESNPTAPKCFACIKSNYAKPICSRDNFAIRPESYDVEIYDDNQSQAKTKNNLSQLYNYSPNSAQQPTGEMQLASGYDYRFDISATGHDTLQYTPGYTRYFNAQKDYNATLLWNSSKTDKVCNDVVDKDLKFYVRNGKLTNAHKKHTNVGEYKLNIIDKAWTAVDWDWSKEQYTYRINNNFSKKKDCTVNSNTTQLQSDHTIGCTIDTNHGSVSVPQHNYIYKDTKIIFHPYKFNVNTITPTIGLTHADVNQTAFAYMANLDKDELMAYHLDGAIVAEGEDNSTLSNFTSQCYAKPLTITINSSDRTLNDIEGNNVRYILHFHDMNQTKKIDLLDINHTDTTPKQALQFSTMETNAKGYFQRSLNGTLQTTLNLNYERNISKAVNPKQIIFTNYTVQCKNNAECTFSANMNNTESTKGVKVLNPNIPITYYYGRVHGQRERFKGQDGNASLHFEVFCDVNSGGDKSFLPEGVNSKFTDDPRWFINLHHTPQRDGKINTIIQRGYTALNAHVTTKKFINGTTPVALLHYDNSRGYPYKTTMEINASNWLIYNKYNNKAKTNEFEVEFLNSSGKWAGQAETDSTTKKNASEQTNRRLMW